MNANLPLTGLRVIDYSHFLAGPYVGRCLAALGAEVIKVERPTTGDAGRQHAWFIGDHSGYFLQQNMGKKGVCVNLKTARGRELLQRLVDSADVFVENYRPGALDKLGLGYRELAERNPRLVYCSISAYGHTGPDSHRAGFGLIAEAKSGIMQMVGTPGDAPPLLRIALGDLYTGAHAVAAINAALLGRERSGRGQHIDMALYDSLISMHEYAVQCYTLSGGTELPVQTGHDLPTSTLYGVFRAADGDLVIAAQVDDAWKRLAALVEGSGGPAGLAADTRFHSAAGRNAHRAELVPIVRDWAAHRPVAQLLAMLDEVDVPCAKVQRIDEVLADPQVRARGMLVEQQHPVLGSIRLPNLPFRFSDCDTTITQVAPELGQHNAEVAASLGFSAAEIAAMQADGSLYSTEPRHD
ncbi:CaiB/BaiF CoA transferase family protein [Derxia gummosa]|uniref:CaiB/BaiF CoA transferase family protein n=1 Tax=Derxia gummosa DSM 723 TaxID=1121388 RepID=A0A8B6X2L8_9BURK|nr:CoA transferase [Derxia gummosa]